MNHIAAYPVPVPGGYRAMVRLSQCSVAGCVGKAKSRGWCNKHWKRWARHGDPQGGRNYKGETLAFYNEQILSYEGDECLVWPFGRDSKGYPKMTFDGKYQRLGRIICEKVHGPAPSSEHEAAHSCGNGHLGCVTQGHHRWATHKENIADKFAHGTNLAGEDAPPAKLTEPEVQAIRRLKGKLSQREIGLAFNVHQMTISDILTGKTWRGLSE